MAQTQNGTPDKSLGELLGNLARDMSTLVRKEVQLAKVEITEKIGATVRGSALLIVAAVLGLVAFQVFVAAAVLALAQTLSPPLAALTVGVLLLVITGICAVVGLGSLKKGVDSVPHQTVETLKDDAKWVKEQI